MTNNFFYPFGSNPAVPSSGEGVRNSADANQPEIIDYFPGIHFVFRTSAVAGYYGALERAVDRCPQDCTTARCYNTHSLRYCNDFDSVSFCRYHWKAESGYTGLISMSCRALTSAHIAELCWI